MAKKNTSNVTAEKKKKACHATVYIGKSLPGLSTNTTFKGGVIPEHVKKMIAENPAIEHLIVPVDRNLPLAKKNVYVKGHVLNHFALQIK